MKTFLRLIFLLFLSTAHADAATIYIDNASSMPGSGAPGNSCSGNYSIANRNCSGSDGNAYTDVQAARDASSASDTIYFRAGSHTSNCTTVFGCQPKNAQTWGTYPGDGTRAATITGHPNGQRVFGMQGADGVHDVVIRDLTIVGPGSGTASRMAIFFQNTQRGKAINNDISAWARDTGNENYAIAYWGQDNASPNAIDGEITDNYFHDPGSGVDPAAVSLASIGTTYVSNILVARNRVVGTKYALWMDVNACDPNLGATPCRFEDNYVKQPTNYCFLAEIGSSGYWRRNICDSPGVLGLFLNPRQNNTEDARIQNNTFYLCQETCIWISGAADPSGTITDILVDNNIMYSETSSVSPMYVLLTVGDAYVSETTSRFRNNLFHSVNVNNGICWADPDVGETTGFCNGAATVYADTSGGISSWQAAAPANVATSNIAGDPLFANPAGEDFRLCTAAGVPHVSCSGASPAINAGVNVGLPFNGSAPDIGAVETIESSGTKKFIIF